MIIANHESFILKTSFNDYQMQYIDGNHKKAGLKVAATSHTDGTQQIVIHHIDVGGSATPFLELRLTSNPAFENVLDQIHSGKERVGIKAVSFECVGFLEEPPQKSIPSGEITVRFSIEKYL
jgi:hypothetical protein